MNPTESVASPKAPGEAVTEKIAVPPAMAFDPRSEPEDWPTRGPAKGFRVNWLSAILLFLLIAGGGIWGGAELQKHDGSSSSSSVLSALQSRFANRTGTSRTGAGSGFTGGSTRATAGTVTEVKGSTLYVTNASGNLVVVTLTPSTSVTRNAKSTAAALQPGDTVIVEGSTSKSGSVTASSVAATAQGVTTGGGFFGGGAGGTGGAGAGSGG